MKKIKLNKKNIWTIVVSLVVVLAITASIITPLLLPKEENIGYSFEDENKPIEYGAVNKLIFNMKLAEALKYNFFIIDKNNYIGNGMLAAMSKARIPTEKMLAFADYLGELAKLIKDSGFSVGKAKFDNGNIKNEDNLFTNFDKHFSAFFTKTGFTEVELGRFIYELALDITDGSDYGLLLKSLGRDEFVTLSTNTIYSYNMLKNALISGGGAAEARALQAIVYSLGSNYTDIIAKLGSEGIEKLLGLNFDLEIENTRLTDEEFAIYQSALLAGKGKISNIVYTIGESIKSTDAYSFELLFSYIAIEDKDSRLAKEKLVLSHIELSKAIERGLEKSFVEQAEIENIEDFVHSYSLLMKEYKKFLEMTAMIEETSDYEAYGEEAKLRLEHFVDCVYTLSQTEIQDIENMSEQDLNSLVELAKGIWTIADDAEEYANQTFSMLLFNFLLKVVDVETFLESNRRALQDLINDSLQGLINIKELEELIEYNN